MAPTGPSWPNAPSGGYHTKQAPTGPSWPPPPTGATSRNRPPRGGLPDTSASGRGASFIPKSTASGRATRRASSDPGCNDIGSTFQEGPEGQEGGAYARMAELVPCAVGVQNTTS